MSVYLTDEEIEKYIQEPKMMPQNWLSRIELKEKRGHKERDIKIEGKFGEKYQLILRQGMINPLDFSVILGIYPQGTNHIFRLLRYNGKHVHTNKIEGNSFDCVHIHKATQRYQELGTHEDAYAEPTNVYSDYNNAVRSILHDCGFEFPENSQVDLFEGKMI